MSREEIIRELRGIEQALNGMEPKHYIFRIPPYGPSAYAQAMNEIVDVIEKRIVELERED